jgi:hypothetical protein
MKNNRVKLYVIWPILPSDYEGQPRLFSAEFVDLNKVYRCDKSDYPDDGELTFRAFGWSVILPKEMIEKGEKLKYSGFPALTPQKAEGRWREHLQRMLRDIRIQAERIQAALRGFKTPKELKHEDENAW